MRRFISDSPDLIVMPYRLTRTTRLTGHSGLPFLAASAAQAGSQSADVPLVAGDDKDCAVTVPADHAPAPPRFETTKRVGALMRSNRNRWGFRTDGHRPHAEAANGGPGSKWRALGRPPQSIMLADRQLPMTMRQHQLSQCEINSISGSSRMPVRAAVKIRNSNSYWRADFSASILRPAYLTRKY
jgi:hypothetical protein